MIVFLLLLSYTYITFAEPGQSFIGATFKETFPNLGELTGSVTAYTPPVPSDQQSVDLTKVEAFGLYKVEYSDGDHAQLYYSDLIKRGAKLNSDL